jgi:hypothetical protein
LLGTYAIIDTFLFFAQHLQHIDIPLHFKYVSIIISDILNKFNYPQHTITKIFKSNFRNNETYKFEWFSLTQFPLQLNYLRMMRSNSNFNIYKQKENKTLSRRKYTQTDKRKFIYASWNGQSYFKSKLINKWTKLMIQDQRITIWTKNQN